MESNKGGVRMSLTEDEQTFYLICKAAEFSDEEFFEMIGRKVE
jgi:hypothetical protein